MKLCGCGCGEPAPIAAKTRESRGHVEGQPIRFIQHHHNRISQEMYAVDPSTQCWNWLRAVNTNGYGTMTRNGANISAHRWMYIQRFGPIPDGLQLDHICRNRLCVNPDHLRLATNAQNNQNRDARGNRGNSSGYRGVSWDKGMKKWLAHATVAGTLHRLGYYATPEEASDVAADFRAQYMPFSVEAAA